MRTAEDNQTAGPATPAPAATASRRSIAYSLYFLIVLTVGFLAARIPVIIHRFFDVDEFEHTHAAWCVFKGLVPYRDFFEHHTPWYYYLIGPFFRFFAVDSSFESAKHFLVFGRLMSLLLTILSVVVIIVIGRLWANTKVGLLAGFFLVSQPVVFQKTVEMRPDVFGLPFFLGCLALLVSALDLRTNSPRKRWACLVGAGLCLGAAIMCTQKMLFAIPGMAIGLGIWAVFADQRTDGKAALRLLSTVACGLAMGVPAALTWALFALGHGGYAFIANNFLLNSKWTHVSHEQLLKVLETSWPVLILSLLGATASLYEFFRRGQRQFATIVLVTTLLGLIVGILVVPGAHRQYYLMPLPIVCLFAAQGLSWLIELGRRPWVLVAATIALAILPIQALAEAYREPNDAQLAKLRFVLENTKPTDVVMDGIQGMGVFRPHAIYYYFLHAESLEMLTREQLDVYVDELLSGRVRPTLIALDENLIALGVRFLHFVRANYRSSDGFFYFSKATLH